MSPSQDISSVWEELDCEGGRIVYSVRGDGLFMKNKEGIIDDKHCHC